LKTLDLFAGCGGMSLGFHRAGYEIIGGVENDERALQTHNLNFGHDCPVTDITVTPPECLAEFWKISEHDILRPDIIVGGPPCQAFARIGRGILRQLANNPHAHIEDSRSKLYIEYLRYVDHFRPRAVLIENVPDILNFGGMNVGEEIANSLDVLGYRVKYTLLNAAHYGVPQSRLRFILLAIRTDLHIEPSFPEPTHAFNMSAGHNIHLSHALKLIKRKTLFDAPRYFIEPPETSLDLPPAVTVEQALGDLPPITEHLDGIAYGESQVGNEPASFAKDMRHWPYFSSDLISDHKIRRVPRDYRIFAKMAPGDRYAEAIRIAETFFREELGSLANQGQLIESDSEEYFLIRNKYVPPYDKNKFKDKWRKLSPDQPAHTLTAHLSKDTYSHIHYDPSQARGISVREAARLQSFPDGFAFAGNMGDKFRQIGNAVPPLLAYRLAEHIRQLLNRANASE
jgi:DNA (cytosine-5)-methyltransferase 1